MTKFVKLEGPLANSGLAFRSLRGVEALGVPFEYRVVLLNPRGDLDLRKFLGRACSISFRGSGDGLRSFHGLISHARLAGLLDHHTQYEVVLRPHLWFLSRSRDSRIFQGMTVPQILKKVFDEQGLDNVKQRLQGTYPERDYCVQYQESTFDFVSRLMEEVGIYYHFEHVADKHTLILCDSPQAHQPAPGPREIAYRTGARRELLEEYLTDLESSCSVQPSTHVATDYNFEKPRVDLQVRQQERNLQAPGMGEFFEYPGLYGDVGAGEGLSRLRVEEWAAQSQQYSIQGTARGPAAGYALTLKGHPQGSLNRQYVVRESNYTVTASVTVERSGSEADVDFRATHIIAASDIPYRSPRRTARPRIAGPQTALVVGPSGQELYCDKYGRVKVQFPWDRLGRKDENSSCWIRVAQSWAGKQWGAVFLPRIGHEVLVEFLEGDPDRPIITGSVYNADLMPPYALPDNLTQSGLKTRSLDEGTDDNFNEFRFEDKKDAEQVYLHAERDFDRVVENNDTLKVGFGKKEDGNQTIEIFNNQSTAVGNKEAKEGNQNLKVWKDQTTTVGGQQILKVGFGGDGNSKDGGRSVEIAKDLVEEVGNDHKLTVKNNHEVKVSQGHASLEVQQGNHEIKIASGTQTVEAAQKIVLKVGASSITIAPDGITLEAVKIELKSQANMMLKAQAQLSAEGCMVDVKSSGILNLKGSLTKIN